MYGNGKGNIFVVKLAKRYVQREISGLGREIEVYMFTFLKSEICKLCILLLINI